MTPRRSRMHRTRTGKCLALTMRDLEIFRALCRYRFLRSTYLHAFVGGASEKRFKERLGDLFHEGYLDRPTEQWRFTDARFRPVVHDLGKGGRATVCAHVAPDPITWLRDEPHRQFEHSLMICEVLASIELAIRARSNLQFVTWPEILAKAPESTRRSAKPYQLTTGNGPSVIPDAIFGIEYRREGRKAYRFFALEADRGTMPLRRATPSGTSLIGKLDTYRAILSRDGHHALLGIPNLLVLTVTNSVARCTALTAAAIADGAPFLFKVGGNAALSRPNAALLLEPWLRAGLPPLGIDA